MTVNKTLLGAAAATVLALAGVGAAAVGTGPFTDGTVAASVSMYQASGMSEEDDSGWQ
jgi:hypothetical protein